LVFFSGRGLVVVVEVSALIFDKGTTEINELNGDMMCDRILRRCLIHEANPT